jgi:hypothetical protein
MWTNENLTPDTSVKFFILKKNSKKTKKKNRVATLGQMGVA